MTALSEISLEDTKVLNANDNLLVDLGAQMDSDWWNEQAVSGGGDVRIADDTGTKFGSETAYSFELENFNNNGDGTGTGILFVDSSGHIANQNSHSIEFVASNNEGAHTDSNWTGFNTSAVTLECWFKANSPGTNTQLVACNDGTNYIELIKRTGYTMSVGGVGSAPDISASKVEDGEWHHLAGTFDGTNVEIYLDGELQGSNAPGGSMNTPSAKLGIGYRPTDNSLHNDGKIDDVRTWNTVRTESEINSNRHAELNGTELGLTLYWKANNSTTEETGNYTISTKNSPSYYFDSAFFSSTQTWRVYCGDANKSMPADGGTLGAENVYPADNEAVYHHGEASGSTASDSTSNNIDGTYNGNLPTQTSGKVGNAQSLDGGGDYNDLGTQLPNVLNGDFTIVVWASKDNTNANQAIVSIQDNFVYIGYEINEPNGHAIQIYDGNNQIISSGNTTTGSQQLHVLTLDSSAPQAKYYIDAQSQGTLSKSPSTDTSRASVYGNRGSIASQDWAGNIDEGRIISSLKGSGWIKTFFNNQSAPTTFWTTAATETQTQAGSVYKTDGSGVIQTDSNAVIQTQ
jgi:hypothetical protein